MGAWLDCAARRFDDGIDDVLITGTAAQIAGNRLAHFAIAQRPARAQQRIGGHQKTRRAEAALQGVILFERLLQRAQRIFIRQRFHRGDFRPVGLHRQHQARAHRRAVVLHRAAAAHAMLAADMGAGQRQLMAQKIGETLPAVDFLLNRLAVDSKFDSLRRHDYFALRALCQASTNARRVNTLAKERR